MQHREPEWKQRMRESARRCRIRVKELKERGIVPSQTKIAFHPAKELHGRGRYACPFCDSDLFHDHDPHGDCFDVCTNIYCDYWHYGYNAD